jgi:hypothetical protein
MDFQFEGFRVADGHIIIEMHLPMNVIEEPINTESVNTDSITTAPVTTAPVTTTPVTTTPVTTAPVTTVSTYVEPIEENLPLEDEPIALINSLVGRLKNLRNKQQLLLPIKKVKNINVEVTITKTNKKFYEMTIIPLEFRVEENALLEESVDRMPMDNTEEDFIYRTVRRMLYILKNIKIDKYNGRFVAFQSHEQLAKRALLWTNFYQEFKEDENIVLTINECCVCFTLTETTTSCDHAVCLECISRLRTETEDDNDDHKNCPMCRQRIYFLQ